MLLRLLVRPNIQTLLDSLTELSQLLYLLAHLRCPKLVLRLHNQAFIHAMICKEVIGKPKSLTERKFYGTYWHSLTAHAAKQSRIVSLNSTNTEEEERHFNNRQGVTKLTHRRPGDIITPSLICLQAEQKLKKSKHANSSVKTQESQISKYYSTLPPFPNTVVPNRYIIKHPKEYQVHLQSISDFIACGEGVWWHQILAGVEFFDGPEEANTRPQGPKLHHFRSSNLQLEEYHLSDCWERCLSDDTITIPHRIIRTYNQQGDCTSVIQTNSLYRDDESDSEGTPIQEEIENEGNEDPVPEPLHMDDDDEITALEEIITPDLSVENSDDEDAHEELQPLITSLPFPVVVNDTATNLQHHTRNDKSSRSQSQQLNTTGQQIEKSLSRGSTSKQQAKKNSYQALSKCSQNTW